MTSRTRRLSVCASAALLVVAGTAVGFPKVDAGADTPSVTVRLDPGLTFQTVDGFGESLVDQVAGESGLPYNLDSLAPTERGQVENLLFSPSAGIGLSMLRIELGAGQTYPNGNAQVPDYTIEPTAPTSPSAAPTYVWNGSADGQVQIVKDARARGVSTVYANAWSAPAFMKTNNNVYGGTLCGFSSCSSGDWRQAYANYLTKYVQNYAGSGVTLDYVSPVNEPQDLPNWQSMSASPTQLASFVATLGTTFSSAGLSTKIASADVADADESESFQQAIAANPGAAAAQSVDSFHSYGGTPAGMPTAVMSGKHSWQSEYTCVNDTWNTGYSTGDCDGQFWAQRIYTAMNNGTNAFLGWTGAWSHTDNEDLIRITGPTSYQVSSRLWAMGNYSRYVKAGAQRIEAASSSPNVLSTAYRNPDGSVVLVATNTSSSPQTLALSGLTGGSVTPVVTNDTSQLAVQPAVAVGSAGTTVTEPASSTVTYVFSGANATASPSYRIASANGGSLISIANVSTAEGATLWQFHEVNSPAQWWYLTSVGGGYFTISSQLSGKVATIDPPVTSDNAPVTQRTYAGTDQQKWRIDSVAGGTVLLQNKGSGLLLSVDGASTADQSIEHQFHYVNSPAQSWILTPTS